MNECEHVVIFVICRPSYSVIDYNHPLGSKIASLNPEMFEWCRTFIAYLDAFGIPKFSYVHGLIEEL